MGAFRALSLQITEGMDFMAQGRNHGNILSTCNGPAEIDKHGPRASEKPHPTHQTCRVYGSLSSEGLAWPPSSGPVISA